jgi:hypothetical protein
MTRFNHRPAIVGIIAIAALTLVACTEAAPSNQADAEQALCDSLTAFGTSLTAFRDLDPATASVEDVETARDDVQEAWVAVQAAAGDIDEADDTAVDEAWQGVSDSVDEFSTDVPISEALVPVQDAAGDVQSAYEEMRDGVGCG